MSYPVTQSVLDKRRRKALGVRLCFKCKQEKPIEQFRVDRSHSTGRGYMCNICARLAMSKLKRPTPEQVKAWGYAYVRGPGKFSKAKISARRRGFEWAISKEDYEAMMKLPCAYCDGPLPEAGVALDRKDSSLGYLPGNVVQCCRPCNVAKSDFFTYEEMMATLGPAIKYLRKRRTEKM